MSRDNHSRENYNIYLLSSDEHQLRQPDHRSSHRRPLGSFDARLETADEQPITVVRPCDVSRRGLGLVLREPIAQGTWVWLTAPSGRRVCLEVVYCDNVLGLDAKFRVGLFLRDQDANLLEMEIGAAPSLS